MKRLFVFSWFCLISLILTMQLGAQELVQRQRNLADRYEQLEQILLRMAEATGSTDPKRALLLKKTLAIAKDRLLAIRMKQLGDLLDERRLTETIQEQEQIEKDLVELLRLLESENRVQRRDAEKEQIKQFLRELDELIHKERHLKNNTAQESTEQIKRLEQEQTKLQLQATQLANRINEHENPGSQPQTDPKKVSSENNSEGNAKDDSESAQKNSSNASPTNQAMQKARERMKKAAEKLNLAEKNLALEEQEEAIAEMQRAKAELEKILRQIREEELFQTLEKLEARLKRMLRVEQAIRTQTETLLKDLNESGELMRRSIDIRASRLSLEQQTVLDDADAALVILREDGTAQAMVESMLQARFDMDEVRKQLEKGQPDKTTIQVEDAVIDALQEMLQAVDMAIREAKKREEDENPPTGEAGQETPEPLIQILSELRMIRSMQKRVNERTARCDQELEQLKEQPNPDWSELKQKVDELARQQNRISKILHDLKLGKAK